MQPKKHLKVQYIGIFFRNSLFLLTKKALLERGPKNLGMGIPPPLIRAMPKRKHFFPLRPSLIIDVTMNYLTCHRRQTPPPLQALQSKTRWLSPMAATVQSQSA